MKPSPPVLDYFPWSLQLSARSWQELEIAPALLEAGPASSLFQLRLLSERLRRYGQAVPAGRLHALSLLNRVFRFLAGRHLEERRCRVGAGGVAIRDRQVKLPALTPTLSAFVHHFPPAAVCRGCPPPPFSRAGTRPDTAATS